VPELLGAGVTPVLEAALAGRAAGLCVIPPSQDGSKAPFGPWKHYQEVRPTSDEIVGWYTNGSTRTGVGVICGRVSGGLEMLEFEGRAVEEGLHKDFLNAAKGAGLADLLGRIIGGYMERTPSGGIHLLYRCSEVEGNQKLARRPARDEELAEDPNDRVKVLIETRGEGGFVIVAPSHGQVHPSGRSWQLCQGGFADIATISPEERAELLTLARAFDRMPKPTAAKAPSGTEPRPDEGRRPGDDFNAQATWSEILEPHGWAYLFTASDGNQHWRRPGKAIGTSATVSDDGAGCLYVFSSSTPFEPETAYTRFAAYAVLNHSGDFGAAARSLVERGYGASTHQPHAGAAPAKSSAPAPPRLLTLRWVEDVHDNPPPEPPILIDGLLRVGELVVAGAPRASYKSWFAMNLAALLGRGEGLFLGTLPVRQSARVLLAQGELDEWGSWNRWRLLAGTTGPPPGVAESFDRWRLRIVKQRTSGRQEDGGGGGWSEEWHDAVLDGRLEATIAAERFDVLIIDPWAVYFAGNENDNDETEAALDKLRDLAMRYGLAIVVLHHLGKGTEARDPEDLWRGASRLPDWASTRVTMLPHYTAKQAADQGMTRRQARRYIDVHFLRRSTPTDDFSIVFDPETGWLNRWMAPAEAAESRRVHMNPVDVAAACAADGGDWPSVVKAAEALNVSEATARKLLAEAVRAGVLEPYAGPRNASGHRLPGDGQCLL
jgi:hypothetical protein